MTIARRTVVPVPFYVHRVTTPEEAEVATRTLIRAAQKRALDLPALVLNPVFENRLVFWLCHARITPNQVTVFTGILGASLPCLLSARVAAPWHYAHLRCGSAARWR